MTNPHGDSAGPVIAVVGHYGNRNLGDESIITAALAGLRRHIPDVIPIAVSMDPADSARRHGVAAFPVRRTARSPAVADPAAAPAPVPPVAASAVEEMPPRRGVVGVLLGPARALACRLRAVGRALAFMRRMRRFARDVDLVMVTGSNQFLDDFGGAGGYPWTLFQWALMARLAGTPVAFVSVGAGPLTGRTSRALAAAALALAGWVSWRDAASRDRMEGRSGRGHVYPELAFGLRPDVGTRGAPVHSVGINPMPVFDARYWPDGRAERYSRYVAVMATAVARLRERGLAPFLYAMQPGDERVIEDIAAALRETGSGEPVPAHAPATLEELFDLLRTADLLVPTRFHGTVLGLVCGRPVFSLCYHRKTADVMHAVGLGEHVLPLHEIDIDRLVEGVETLAARAPSVHATIDTAVAANRAALEEQYARIARLVALRRPLAEPRVRPS